MKLLDKIRSRGAAFSHDLLMIPVAWLGAYWLRFNLGAIPDPFMIRALEMLSVVIVIQGGIFWYFGLYRGVWRFASVPDLVRITKAVLVGVILTGVAVFLFTQFKGVPRSVFPLYGLLLIALLGGPRFIYRWFKDHKFYQHTGRKAIIVGAGSAGEMLVRDMLRAPERPFQPVAFVDDDAGKKGREIHGLRVEGSCRRIPKLVSQLDIELILIAIPSATSKQVRRIVEICEKTGVAFRILPRFQDLVTGKATLKALRDVQIEDLLGREKVTLDWNLIRKGLTGKSVMVTGGGGSIGSELCRQVAKLGPSKLIVFERSEFNLYKIDLELRKLFPGLSLASILGDVGDSQAVEQALKTHRPAVIFHAAAYKHVPLLENQLRAAVMNNIFGTRNMLSKALEFDCEAFVLISTDKAVNPVNVMGVTKRIAELYCHSFEGNSKTRHITVRFGNVLASAGSVIPLFREQIAAGGPVTVTDPEITRYFMTIEEACQLILQACAIGRGGEIFVLDMGEPVKIAYLAEQLILLSGKKPNEEVNLVYTGLRPGEKMYEELFYDTEKRVETDHPKILFAQSPDISLKLLEQSFQDLEKACHEDDEVRIKKILDGLVPEEIGRDKRSKEKKSAAVVYNLKRQ